MRPKIERYASLAERTETIELYAEAVEMVWIDLTVRDCRDMKDNKFLEVALCGRAELLVTGDLDLLCLHPWRGIAILSPADYLAQAG